MNLNFSTEGYRQYYFREWRVWWIQKMETKLECIGKTTSHHDAVIGQFHI